MLTKNQIEDFLREASRRSPRRAARALSDAVAHATEHRDPNKKRKHPVRRRKPGAREQSYYDGPLTWDAWSSPNTGRQRPKAVES